MCCVKCGGPRGSLLCAYCGTNYESNRPWVGTRSDQHQVLEISRIENEQTLAMNQIRAQQQSVLGIYDSLLGTFRGFGR